MRRALPTTLADAVQTKRASVSHCEAMPLREERPAITAKSSSPRSRPSSSALPMSTRGSSTRAGWVWRTSATSLGSQVSAVSSPTPNVQRPDSPCGAAVPAFSAAAASSNWRAWGSSAWPASVSVARWPLRSNRVRPSDCSSSVKRLDSDEIDKCTRCAAVVKLAQVAAQ